MCYHTIITKIIILNNLLLNFRIICYYPNSIYVHYRMTLGQYFWKFSLKKKIFFSSASDNLMWSLQTA